MARNLMPSLGYALRWLGWGVQWLVIAPLGTLTLAVVVLAGRGGDTPGQMLVQYAESVSTSSASGVWFYARCAPDKKTPAPTAPCPQVKTDAAGYAAYIDQTLAHLLRISWLTFAALYAGFALATGCIPSRWRGVPITDGRSAQFRYGRPTNDLAEHAEHKDKP
ncbi:conjugal transfer protein TraP [Cedecea sp. NFIX57]|uniref:conjugal transfer protein TraP n=1 Tax=Cedecea sp. NFIX57 TaxID=1566286 RepID=UPI000A0AA0D4|nr:conjugal transfer protein TraP [Cedecea sp. NFIX57]SMG59739.1 TraP protein [Cedecea sp. NFIX57]